MAERMVLVGGVRAEVNNRVTASIASSPVTHRATAQGSSINKVFSSRERATCPFSRACWRRRVVGSSVRS